MIHFEMKQKDNIMYKFNMYRLKHFTCFPCDVRCAHLL